METLGQVRGKEEEGTEQLPPQDVFMGLPKQLYEKSSAKAMLRLVRALAYVSLAYVVLTQLPWYLLPLGWLLVGTTMGSLLAVAYACHTNAFFNNTLVNHVVGQLALLPLMTPFESWHDHFTQKKETMKQRVTDYLSRGPFWWSSSYWQFLVSNVEGFLALAPCMGTATKKRIIGNVVMLYIFVAIFFPLMAYNVGLWGLCKYYFFPLMVYHFWASSFLKTSSILKVLQIQHSDFVTLAYYKYPKWVEFLSLELNYAISSLQHLHQVAIVEKTQKFSSAFKNYLDEDEEDDEEEEKEMEKESEEDEKLRVMKREGAAPPFAPTIPYYNLKEAINFIRNHSAAASIKASSSNMIQKWRLEEHSFFSLIFGFGQNENETNLSMREMMASLWKTCQEINWVTTTYLFVTPLIALYGLITCEHYWQTWLLAFVHYQLGGQGITMGYHRLFSHRSFSAHPIVKYILLFFATGCFQMSCLDWANDHRAHHRYTDTPKDPYNINNGFWYAHMGWLLRHRKVESKSDISDLRADPVLRFQHKWFLPLAVLQGYVLPTVIAGLFWGDWWGGFFIAGIFSRVIILQSTFCVNSVAHYWGDFTYADQRSPKDSWLVGLLTFGEGYHNFHHEFPYDYRNGAHWKAFDPTKWIIWALSFVGLTYDLKLFSKETIAKGKLQMKEKQLIRERERLHWGPPEETLPYYTEEQVAQLCSRKEGGSAEEKEEEELRREKLIIVDGYVHEVSQFMEEHPAGAAIMKPYLGKDASQAFNITVYNHSNAARNILQTLRIARVKPSSPTSSPSPSSPSPSSSPSPKGIKAE
ncbi:Acyl-CoA desaturase [Balamuthia mandrillaris]